VDFSPDRPCLARAQNRGPLEETIICFGKKQPRAGNGRLPAGGHAIRNIAEENPLTARIPARVPGSGHR